MPSIWTYADVSDRGYGLFKRKILDVFHSLGWKVYFHRVPLLDASAKSSLRENLLEQKTDWLLLINQTACQFYDYIELPTQWRPLTQKKFIWFLDDPTFFLNQPFEPMEYVFSFDEAYVDTLKAYQPGAYGLFPLAADMERQGEYHSRLACDLSFVGGMMDQREKSRQLSPEMRKYVALLVEKKLHHREKTFAELTMEYPMEPGRCIHINPQVAHFLYWEANNLYRLRTLEALRDYNVRIYGNEEWERVLENHSLRAAYQGPIDPVTELPHVFASSKINLNIHSIQCRGSLNQRDFNAPIAGGFLLSDWVPAAGKYFQPGQEAIYWSDHDNLRRKVDYYLEHESERQSIVHNAWHRVQRDHVYEKRVKSLLHLLGL